MQEHLSWLSLSFIQIPLKMGGNLWYWSLVFTHFSSLLIKNNLCLLFRAQNKQMYIKTKGRRKKAKTTEPTNRVGHLLHARPLPHTVPVSNKSPQQLVRYHIL